MLSLTETQARLSDAMVTGDRRRAQALVTGGADPAARLAIHLRHYEASLVDVLLGKFPACAWLLGKPFVEQAARAFVHLDPPTVPCIAEYGAGFPAFLAELPAAANSPYLRWFAELEWCLGHASVAIDHGPLTIKALQSIAADALAQVTLALQPGLFHLRSPWPVDGLMKLYLSETAPDHYLMEPEPVWLEVAGARGALRLDRLDEAELAFRQALAAGTPIGTAAELALDADAAFDPGQALTRLFAARLVTAAARATAP